MPSAPSLAWGKQLPPLKGGAQQVPGETEAAGLEACLPHLLAQPPGASVFPSGWR